MPTFRIALGVALSAALLWTPPASAEPLAVKGVTQCLKDLSLGFPVAGRLAEVAVTEGTEVKAGTTLAHLDLVAETLEVQRRKLQWESNAEVIAAAARRQTTEKQMAAAKRIFDASQGISREEMENKALAHSLAVAEHDRLKNAKQIEKLDYLAAEENLARRTLRAPSPGIVTKLVKNVGESVQANEPAIKMCDLSKLLFVANVPAASLGTLAARDAVKLQVTVGADTVPVDGKVLFVSPVVDAASGLTEVKVELLPSGDRIRPGLQARLMLGK
ncbi:efflux RND transporter periplasmic adaptor subunit [Azospirillum sp. sgz302134]